MARILCVDNYDSFVFTIVGYLRHLGAVVDVVRNDVVDPAWFEAGYDGVLISPGPGDPKSAGASLQTIADCAEREIPMLGVCLGHQIIATALGAKLKSGDAPEIGFAPIKRIDKHDFFSMWNKTLDVLHWHNDVVTLPEGATPLARSEKTKNQAFRFGSALGLQFHLEVTPTLLDEWLDEPCMVKDLKAAGGSKSQLRDAFAEYNPQLQPMADQVFSGFAARCSTYAATLER